MLPLHNKLFTALLKLTVPLLEPKQLSEFELVEAIVVVLPKLVTATECVETLSFIGNATLIRQFLPLLQGWPFGWLVALLLSLVGDLVGDICGEEVEEWKAEEVADVDSEVEEDIDDLLVAAELMFDHMT